MGKVHSIGVVSIGQRGLEMDGLIIGLDLCDSYTQISCGGQEDAWTYPTIICKKKESDDWYIGEEAYRLALEGEGVIVDKLLQFVKKDGISTIGGTRYESLELLQRFLEKALEDAKEKLWEDKISQLCITLPKVDARLMDVLMYCGDYLGVPRENVHIISHTEAFAYYVLSQKKDVWNNQVGMFDLTEESLCYYEMKVQRGLRQTTVVAEREKLEEGFNLDILKTASGMRLADKILLACGERPMQKTLYSSVFLTGKGFESQDWATDFMKMVCTRRKVFVDSTLFSKGACYRAADCAREKTSYPFVFVCDGRLNATVSVKAVHREKETQLVLAAAGDSWYEAKTTVDFIVDNQREIEFLVTPIDPKKKKTLKLSLDGFPERGDKTLRIQVNIGFLDENTMVIVVKDKGFGELFPATDAMIREEVML